MAKVKYSSGYGPENKLPNSIVEGQLLFATDTRAKTLDADGVRIRFNPPGDWNETDPDSPAYIANKPVFDDIINDLKALREIQGHMYGVIWDKTSSAMRRLFDSEDITLDTTNFVYSGSVNDSYDNPFDDIYPWSECKQCNVDLDIYRSLGVRDDIRDCVVAWYGDPDFTTDGSNGFVGRYTPEFWYYGFEDTRGKIVVVADRPVEGFLHHKASIRSHGFAVDDGNDGVTSNDGQPMTNVACSTIHSMANSSGFTLMDIFEYDAEVALYMVEFADTDTQAKLGEGCSDGYRSPTFTVLTAETGATTVLLPIEVKDYCVPGSTLDFGASKDTVILSKRRTVVSVEDYDSTYCEITFTPALDLTTDLYPSIHGKNNADSIGNKSGYIGVNSRNNAWYRGTIMYGNKLHYVLGVYRQTGTGHLWLATPETADDYDELNTTAHYDTGIEILEPPSNGWQQVADYGVPSALASIGPITKAGSLTNDRQYCVIKGSGNTVALFGGYANYGAYCGVLCVIWANTAGYSSWPASAIALLKSK